MEVVRGSREILDARGASFVASALAAAVSTRGRAVLGLVGGRSVGGLFRQLAAHTEVPWDHVHIFVADERVVPITDEASNWKVVSADLVGLLSDCGRLPPGNAHPFLMDESSPDHGAGRYSEVLSSLGGKFDAVVLSAGEDGHCASLFPHHPSVEDDHDGIILVQDAPKPPPLRISASRRLLERTGTGVVVFLGEGKRSALDLFMEPATTVRDCPSKLVASMREGLVLTDL